MPGSGKIAWVFNLQASKVNEVASFILINLFLSPGCKWAWFSFAWDIYVCEYIYMQYAYLYPPYHCFHKPDHETTDFFLCIWLQTQGKDGVSAQ